MYNKDLFEKLRQEFGDESMPHFCEMVSRMYEILEEHYRTDINMPEYDFERDWWGEKFEELVY